MARKPTQFERLRQDQSASSAVEFALLAPIFLTMLLGMVAYGIYFGASHSVQQIAADAARTAVAGLDDQERRSLALTYIGAHASGYPFVDSTKLSIDVATSAGSGDTFSVTLRYDARDLPIWGLMTGLPVPGMTIARSSTIRVGGI